MKNDRLHDCADAWEFNAGCIRVPSPPISQKCERAPAKVLRGHVSPTCKCDPILVAISATSNARKIGKTGRRAKVGLFKTIAKIGKFIKSYLNRTPPDAENRKQVSAPVYTAGPFFALDGPGLRRSYQ
jgi:hypothetical protein